MLLAEVLLPFSIKIRSAAANRPEPDPSSIEQCIVMVQKYVSPNAIFQQVKGMMLIVRAFAEQVRGQASQSSIQDALLTALLIVD